MSLNLMAGLSRGAAVVGALNGLIPLIGALVQTAETAFPAAGSGAQKFAHVVDTIKTYLGLVGNAIGDVEAIAPVLSLAVQGVVDAAKGKIVQNPQTGQWMSAPSPFLSGVMSNDHSANVVQDGAG